MSLQVVRIFGPVINKNTDISSHHWKWGETLYSGVFLFSNENVLVFFVTSSGASVSKVRVSLK